MLKLGEKSIKSLYLGGKSYDKAYFGSKLVFNKKPYYCEIEYIESTGTQYIESDIQFLGDNYTIKCKYDNSNTGSDTTPFGYQNTVSGIQIMIIGFNNANSTGTIFWNGRTTAHTNRAKLNALTKGLNDIVISANNGILTYQVNGGQKISYETYTAFEPQTDKMWIFGNNRKSASESHQEVKMKFYYLTVEQNGVVLYDYIPVLDNNMKPCLYDKVSGKLFYNQGSGEFIAGGRFVQSIIFDGASLIDTGYRQQTCRVECRIKFQPSTYRQLIGFGLSTAQYWGCRVNGYLEPITDVSGLDMTDVTIDYNTDDATDLTMIISADGKTHKSTGTSLSSGTYRLGTYHANYPVTAEVWYNKIYIGGVLVQDLRPYVDGNGVACFKDVITDTLFYNKGTGEFLYSKV